MTDLHATPKEISQALNRYTFLVTTLHRLLEKIEPALQNDTRWFIYAPKIGRKFWKQSISLDILFKNELSITRDESEKEIIDLSSYFSILRSMFEAYAVFCHLFKRENNIEENIIRFRLWELDGLHGRLRFKRVDPSQEVLEQLAEDKTYINLITGTTQQFRYFQQLSQKQQAFLFKYRAWKFSSDSLRRADNKKWQHSIKELIDRTGINKTILSDLYSFYSMHAHTGYISLLQNDDLPTGDKLTGKYIAIMNGSYVTGLIIDDLSKLFVEGKAFLEELTEKEKNALATVVKSARK